MTLMFQAAAGLDHAAGNTRTDQDYNLDACYLAVFSMISAYIQYAKDPDLQHWPLRFYLSENLCRTARIASLYLYYL